MQGADVLVVRKGTPSVITASAPLPWPTHIHPSQQRWNLLSGPRGERLWWGDQGGIHWGPITNQMETDFITFEERKIPRMGPIKFSNMEIDQLAKSLRGNMSGEAETLQQFHPGIVFDPQEDKVVELRTSTATQTPKSFESREIITVGQPTDESIVDKQLPYVTTAVGQPTGENIIKEQDVSVTTTVGQPTGENIAEGQVAKVRTSNFNHHKEITDVDWEDIYNKVVAKQFRQGDKIDPPTRREK